LSIKWIKFGDDLDENFESDRTPELHAAVEYLAEEAPRNQRVVDGDIEWQEVEPREETELGNILSRVTTVRNNFFHGGKFPRFRERDAKLFRACLIILKECAELHPELKNYYRWQLEGTQG